MYVCIEWHESVWRKFFFSFSQVLPPSSHFFPFDEKTANIKYR